METVIPKAPRKSTVLAEDAFHFPSTSNYSFNVMFNDLLNFSAKHLKLGGRLVCWFPVTRDAYDEKLLPQHSALELVENSEQKLNGEATRRLLTYEKVHETGEVTALPEVDYRSNYFTHGDTSRNEKRIATHERNIVESQKRGKDIRNLYEWKKSSNKKILLDREKNE